VAALVARGFEQDELFEPRKALEQAGAVVQIVSPEPRSVRGWNHTEWGREVPVDVRIDQPKGSTAAVGYGGAPTPARQRPPNILNGPGAGP
jgi:protease I